MTATVNYISDTSSTLGKQLLPKQLKTLFGFSNLKTGLAWVPGFLLLDHSR